MMRVKTRITLAAVAAVCAVLSGASVFGGDCGPPELNRGGLCPVSTGPDVIVGDLTEISRFGSVGNITAYAIGTMACNYGNTNIPWSATTTNHPVITQNVYRLHNGRFSQIGMSWAKHGFTAFQETCCCATCVDPGTGSALGVGCSDIYSAGLNADQGGFSGMGGLGPRSDINPSTGVFSFPYPTQGLTGDLIYKRLQIPNDDMDLTIYPGARFFAEGVYFSAADATAGNNGNNAAWREVEVQGPSGIGGWVLAMIGLAQPLQPAVQAWKAIDPAVQVFSIDVAGDGRMYLACRVTDNGNGTWRYEYALQNYNCHRGASRFSMPSTSALNVSGAGFKDIHHHSGEPFDTTDWAMQVGGDAIAWATTPFKKNSNANALRWGTLYNYWFTADAGPTTVPVEVTLFKPGSPTSVIVMAPGPDAPVPACPADIANSDNTVNVFDLFVILSNWGTNGLGAALASPTNVVDVFDLFVVLGAWGDC